jgi:beta-phosphoglucomutase-like phosphatase (HAD superfamily)
VSGIQSAKAANLVCIGVADRDRSEMLTAAGADHVVENFMGLSPAGLETLLVQSSQKPGHRSNRR